MLDTLKLSDIRWRDMENVEAQHANECVNLKR